MIARKICSTIKRNHKIHHTTGRFIPKRHQSLVFHNNRDLKISKSKKSEQYAYFMFTSFRHRFKTYFRSIFINKWFCPTSRHRRSGHFASFQCFYDYRLKFCSFTAIVKFFQLRLIKKLKINFFCFNELNINKPVFLVSSKQNNILHTIFKVLLF